MNIIPYDEFVKERKLISNGSRSSIYYWRGFAYKCFNDDYPSEWIKHEYGTQKQIVKSKLNVVKFYKSEFKRTIKMDYVKGKTLASSFNKNNKEKLLNDFVNEFTKLHSVKGLKLEKLSSFLLKQIDKAPVLKKEKIKAKKYINEIEKKVYESDALCHMDYHFLNTMYANKNIYVIDFVDARNGKAIYDYARTYVMIYEYATGYKNKYLKKVLEINKYDLDLFRKAVYVNAINRLEEYDDSRVRKLIELIDTNKIL